MKYHLIFVPGLSGTSFLFELTAKLWNVFGFDTHLFPVVWKDNKDLKPKLDKLIDLIDKLSTKDTKISLIGTSAGGSLVLNAFIYRRNKIHRVINVCGRLRAGDRVSPTLEQASKKSKSFNQSIKQFEISESKLTNSDRKKILTLRALFDEIVPTSTTILKGAKNVQIFSLEHMLTITLCLTLYSIKIRNFLGK